MIRFVTSTRLGQLEDEARTARAQARQASKATSEVGAILACAIEELSDAQQELLRKDIEIRRLRAELEAGPAEGAALTVLLHHGEPHAVYVSREDAHADTATHGIPADDVWKSCDERPAAAFTWRCETFVYRAASKGFRRACTPAARTLGGAA